MKEENQKQVDSNLTLNLDSHLRLFVIKKKERISLIVTSLIVSLNIHAQTGPGGVGNPSSNELWLPVEENCYIDAGTIAGINNSNIQLWNDISGNSNNAIQTTPTFKPSLNTNALNGFSTLTFNGSTDRILSAGLTTSSQVTLFTVVQFNNLTNNNDGIIQASPAGTAFTSTTSDKSIGMWINTSNGRIWGRGVQANNVSQNISQTTTLTTGRFYIITQDYNGTSINQYVDGTLAGTVSYNNTLKDWSDFGIGRQANESLDGDLSEIIVHRVSLNSAQRIITENYLAAKYGLSLSNNDLYIQDNVANGNYDYEVAGIGRIDASNIHSDAQGRGIVRILNPSQLDDRDFLIWGHDNEIPQAIEVVDVPVGVQARFERIWRVSEVNNLGIATDVGAIDIRFDLTGLGFVSAADIRLLVDVNNNGLFIDETPIGGAIDLGGNIYQFTGVTAIANNLRFTIGTVNSTQTPLPIGLINFNAFPINNKIVQLNWQTASEINNDYFTIERTLDGNNWQEINTVAGAEYSTSLLNYSAIDNSPYTGVSYYRLKQTDFDGQFSYSQVRSVTIESLKSSQLELYPNPTSNKITIEGEETELKNIHIYTTLGQDVTALTKRLIDTKTKLVIDLSHLSMGIYYIKTNTTSYKVIKQ